MPGYGLPLVPFLFLVPLLALAAEAPDGRRAAQLGLAFGTLAHLPLVYWIAYTVAVPGRLGWAAGAAAALLVAAYLGAYVSAAVFGTRRAMDRFGRRGALLFPAVWTAVELARARLFTGFPWMLSGYALAESPLLRQGADVAGVYGLGFSLALAAALFYLAAHRAREGRRRAAAVWAAAFLAVPACLGLYGLVRDRELREAPKGRALVVALVQGAIDQSVKWDPSYQEETIRIYAALTREARSRGAEIVVWPETAAPFFFGWEPALDRRVEEVAVSAGVPLVFGAPWFDPAAGGRYYNSIFCLDGRGVATGRYDKRRLVPFGEYIPLRRVLFFLRKMTHGEEDFSAGVGPGTLQVAGTVAGASVCYEAVFPEVIRASVREGAQWFVNVTNDAWFGDTVAPRQHLAMARMRSVEFRRPMARAANAGISAVIGIRGEVAARLDVGRRGIVTARVAPGTISTAYLKTGDILGISCIMVSLSVLFIPFRSLRHGIRVSAGTHRGAHRASRRPPGLSLKSTAAGPASPNWRGRPPGTISGSPPTRPKRS